MILDINSAGDANPETLAAVGSVLIFAADDDGTGMYDLWRSDGTEEGTSKLKDFDKVHAIRHIGTINGRALLYVVHASAVEAWSTDGTPAGTIRLAAGPYALE